MIEFYNYPSLDCVNGYWVFSKHFRFAVCYLYKDIEYLYSYNGFLTEC